MKKWLVVFSVLFLFIIPNGSALTSSEIESRDVCSNIELAVAGSDKSLTSVKCFDTYEEAKTEMDNSDNLDLVILERISNKTKIIDAKLALVYLGVLPVTENTYYYSDSSLKTSISYMNHHTNYGATDGVFLELNYSNYAIKVKTNGVVGWIKKDHYKIIPLNFLYNSSYYEVKNNELYHYYSKNIETTYTAFGRVIDSKPEFLNNGKYYSYDGIYFYSNLKDLVLDYKNNVFVNSINKEKPYYNYYMYLPHRGISNYSADDIDAYLKNTKGLIGTIYGKKYVYGYSNMYSAGIFFKSSENLYGSNALLMMSLATNESSLGQSSIAVNKNNLFGHAAYDSSAYDSSTGYLNPYQSIVGHAKSYINCGYANPKDSRYYGSNMGNKASGMNVKYASDPFWGEKAANYYYNFDKDNGFLDKNYYQLGIVNYSDINVRTEADTSSSIPYTIKQNNVPVIILGEVTGTSYNGSNIWYKIVSDANLTNDRKSVQNCSYTNYYNFDSYVYIHSSLITKINKTVNGKYNTNKLNDNSNYTYHEYSNGANYAPVVGLINKDTIIYDTATLSVSTKKTVKTGHLTPIFMEARNKDNKVVAYQIMLDYSKNQKGWVDASSLTITDKNLLKITLNEAGKFLNVYKDVSGTVLGSIYTDTYAVILDSKNYNGNIWLKFYYGVDNTTAWINTNIDSTVGAINYSLDKTSKVPVITAGDKTIYLFDSFNPLEKVTASDSEDGNLTNKIKVIKNNVDVTKSGTYTVSYEVVDSDENKTIKQIKVIVKDYQTGDSLFMYDTLKYISDDKFLFKGFLGIKKMDNINISHYLMFVNQKDNTTYHFKLDKYLDYPYEMDSIDDDRDYDYSGGWFQKEINLSKEFIKQGDYTIYIVACNKEKGYMTKTYFTNIAYLNMERRVTTKTRGFAFDVDYSYVGSPILMSIRDEGLITDTKPLTMDPMYNFFNEIKLDNNYLTINGTSHSIGVSYSKNDTVKREIIFENTNTFKRYTYSLDLFDGLYKVTLPVSDNKDKTKTWFKKTIDLSKIPTGTYAIYIKTTSNNISYSGELIDIAYTNFESINNDKYQFMRNDDKRLRLELTIK